MDGPLGLDYYLHEDGWLPGRTGAPLLHRDPVAERDAALRYLAAATPSWHQLTMSYVDQIPPLSERARLIAFLLTGNEAALIEACLDALGSDLVTSGFGPEHAGAGDTAEIVVVRQHIDGTERDDTADRVRDWAARHRATVTVRLIEVTWPAGCAAFLPLSRKLAVDVTVRRAMARPRTAPLYFLTEDADVEWVERGRARHVVSTLDESTHLDVLRGWHLRSLDLLEYLPLFVERLTWRACEHALADPTLRPEQARNWSFAWNRVVSAGWNVAFTLEAYVLAGGYTPTVELFEDMDLGQRISVMRGRPGPDGFRPATSTAAWMPFEASSDGRRALAALMAQSDLYGAAPSLAGFVDATARARSWSMAEAASLAREPSAPELVDLVLARRRDEVAGMVAGDEALDAVMAAARRELGSARLPALLERQRSFLDAARAVAAGAPSGPRASILRATAR